VAGSPSCRHAMRRRAAMAVAAHEPSPYMLIGLVERDRDVTLVLSDALV
jgi:hypothetical protein